MVRMSAHMCMLVLTLAFLLCEIIMGQICRSLLIAVDSFHTLYVFIHLALSMLKHHTSSSAAPAGLSPEHCRRARLQPFGVLIAALLMASQCVSISLEILTHLIQPEAIQHPNMSIAVGGVSALLNIVILVWRRRNRGAGRADDGMDKSLVKNETHSATQRKESALQDDGLMFCNPEASSVLDPDHSASSCPELPDTSLTKAVSDSKHSQKTQSSVGEGSQEIIQPIEKLPEEPHHSTCTEPTVSQCVPEGSGLRSPQLGLIGVIQDLLSPVLVLTNGLVLLLSHAHCHRRHSDCHLLVYLDAAFSTVCVLVLLSAALPKLRRYGLLVLQATPLHLSVGQVRLSLAEVPGVLSVHELHVWQLSDMLMVASLHVHCPDGMSARDCENLMERIRAVLAAFGIHHCTVQPEFLTPADDSQGRSVCSLSCGQECVEKLCCSPQLDNSHRPKSESPTCVQEENSSRPVCPDEIKDVIIENTYL